MNYHRFGFLIVLAEYPRANNARLAATSDVDSIVFNAENKLFSFSDLLCLLHAIVAFFLYYPSANITVFCFFNSLSAIKIMELLSISES